MRPKSVWVLYGGNSSEREVSMNTGKGIAEALRTKGFEVFSFEVKPGASFMKINWAQPPDIVFIALHGPFGEDGTIQGFLETAGIAYVGSGVSASALSMHKGLSKKQFQQFGIPSPKAFEFSGSEGFKKFLSSLDQSFFQKKWFIKPSREGSTIGIERFDPSLVKNSEAAFSTMCESALKFDSYILVEEWVEGPELTVPVLFGKAMPIVEIRPLSHFYDYKSKYTAGQTEYLCPAPLSENDTKLCQKYAEDVFRVLECEDYGRVDFMLGKDGLKVLEMNTLPGMTATSLVPKSAKAAGMDYATFVEKLVCGSFERQRGASG